MASSTPSAPITSFRGAVDTTADGIYFSTPSAQVQIPVGDLVLPPPPTCAHNILFGGKLSDGGKVSGVGVKFIQRRKNYPAAD